jgi:hypothetical protein
MAKVKGRIEPLTFNDHRPQHACARPSVLVPSILYLVSALTLEASACASLAGTESVRFLHSSVVLYLYTCDGAIKLTMHVRLIRYSVGFHEFAEVGYTLDYMNFLDKDPLSH